MSTGANGRHRRRPIFSKRLGSDNIFCPIKRCADLTSIHLPQTLLTTHCDTLNISHTRRTLVNIVSHGQANIRWQRIKPCRTKTRHGNRSDSRVIGICDGLTLPFMTAARRARSAVDVTRRVSSPRRSFWDASSARVRWSWGWRSERWPTRGHADWCSRSLGGNAPPGTETRLYVVTRPAQSSCTCATCTNTLTCTHTQN